MLHSGVNWKARGPSVYCVVSLSTPGKPPCTSTMSLYLAWTLSRRANTAHNDGDVLTARDGDQRACGQVRAGLAVLPRTDEVAGVDGRRGQVSGLARVATAPGVPDFADLGAILLGDGIAYLLEGFAAVSEVAHAR